MFLPAFPEDIKSTLKGPITVTAETLTADNKANTALFEKNVVVRTSEMEMFADRMIVYYQKEGGNVTRIEAKGNVRLHRNNYLLTSKEATFFADQDRIVLTGEPQAIDGQNVVTGSKMTFFIVEDRFHVENSRVLLKSGQDR